MLISNGYSRIPVFKNDDKHDVVGILRLKHLIGLDFRQEKSIKNLGIELRKPIVISPSITLFDLLREFRKGKSHMAFITDKVEDLQSKLGLNRKNSLVYNQSLLGDHDKNIKILAKL